MTPEIILLIGAAVFLAGTIALVVCAIVSRNGDIAGAMLVGALMCFVGFSICIGSAVSECRERIKLQSR